MNKHLGSSASICIVGLGFVGLPLARQFTHSGLRVIGIDVDTRKIDSLNQRKSYLNDFTDDDIHELFDSGRFECSTDFARLSITDAVLVCVPTPLNTSGLPDLSYVLLATRDVAKHLRQGQLFVLESSTFPGTTEDCVVPMLESSGMKAGVDFYVAYSPERINPGDMTDIRLIPKVVGAINDDSLNKALAIYSRAFDTMVPVSSTRVAEFTKLLENTQRFINIGLMNELTILCQQWGVDLWEAIAAASTKPYGFTPYYPGPGVGGHCIPVDPLYLQWFAMRSGQRLEFIRVAQEVNHQMPAYITERLLALSNNPAPSVLLIGMTYKRNVNDVRESSSLSVFQAVRDRAKRVEFHDPYAAEVTIDGQTYSSVPLTRELISQVDVVGILTDHSNVDYDLILKNARAIFDTRNVYKGIQSTNVVRL